jgi:anti-sigma regulatory factor (Ser/Thr protein kinase)
MDAAALERRPQVWCTEIPGGIDAACSARQLLTERLADSTPEQTMHDLHLLTTELVTNAVLHAGVGDSDMVVMRVAELPGAVKVSVTDPGDVDCRPEVQELDLAIPGGMGLFLVEQISDAWGVERTADGANRVWFEVAA